MVIVTVSGKGQVVIPTKIRRRLSIVPDGQLGFTLKDNSIRIEVKRQITPSQPKDDYGMLLWPQSGAKRLTDFDMAQAMRAIELKQLISHEANPMHAKTDIIHTHRWTVADYHKMNEVGLLAEESAVELINGEIVEMTPIGSKHSSKVKQFIDLLSAHLHGKAILSVQDPIRLGEHSEPEPDIAILCQKEDYYASAHPNSQDVLLLIEVADITVLYDREVKIPLYACHNILEVWLLDLQQQCLEIYLKPEHGKYQQMHRLLSGQASPTAFPEIIIQLSDLFPRKD